MSKMKCVASLHIGQPLSSSIVINSFISTASGALVVGGVRDICTMYVSNPPEIALSVQWSRTNQSVAVCGSLSSSDHQTRPDQCESVKV